MLATLNAKTVGISAAILAGVAVLALGGRAAGNLYRTGSVSFGPDPAAVTGLTLAAAQAQLRPDPGIRGMVTHFAFVGKQAMLEGWAADAANPADPISVYLFAERAFATDRADGPLPDAQQALAWGAPVNTAFAINVHPCAPGTPLSAIAVTGDGRYAQLPFDGADSHCP